MASLLFLLVTVLLVSEIQAFSFRFSGLKHQKQTTIKVKDGDNCLKTSENMNRFLGALVNQQQGQKAEKLVVFCF